MNMPIQKKKPAFRMLRRFALAGVSTAVMLAACAHAQEPSPLAPPPQPARYVEADGSIFIVGNDGMEDLLVAWNALFSARHPEFKFRMLLEGSSTGGPALIAGITPFAPLSRAMWNADLQGFHQQFGYEPLDVKVGYTGHGPRSPDRTPPALYINARNPLAGLTTDQATRIFTRGAAGGDISSWGQLGLAGAWALRTIHVYGLADDGGSATSARELLMQGLPYTARYETLATVADIVKAVADDPYGIGMTGWVDAPSIAANVKVVPLSRTAGRPYASPSYENVAGGNYPYSSFIRFYVNRVPGRPLEPFIRAYLEMVLSPEGQAIVAQQKDTEGGYVPLNAPDIEAELAKLR